MGFLSGGKIWKVAVVGGSAVPLCDVVDDRFGATWGSAETICFADDAGLMRVSSGGGTPELIRPVAYDGDERWLGFPQVLPDERLLLTVSTGGQDRAVVFSPVTGESRVVHL